MSAEAWCVKHRDGWCATKRNVRPGEGVDQVATRCGFVVVFPGGYEYREPDCADCMVVPPRVGDVWRDLDPRGGPRFMVVGVDDVAPGRATVEGLDGKRRRSVLLSRFRAHGGYRSGYTLVERKAPR